MRLPKIGCSVLAALCLAAWPCAAERTVREISWGELKAAGLLKAGEVLEGQASGPAEQLKLVVAGSPQQLVGLVEIDKPGVTTPYYAVQGQVQYDDVERSGHLEMWSRFAGGDARFSRTLASNGPLQKIVGSSNWRPFVLPFFSDAKAGPPTHLQINLVLEGPGTVRLGRLKLVEVASRSELEALTRGGRPDAWARGWWGETTGGLIGAIAGSLFGILGGLVGVLAGFGRARGLVVALMLTMIAAGTAALAVGLAALILGQPYPVYYPLLLLGLLATVIPGALLPNIRRRYAQVELRKMAAADIG